MNKTNVFFLVDKSNAVQKVKADAVKLVNETIKTLTKNTGKNSQINFLLTPFNCEKLNESISDVSEFSPISDAFLTPEKASKDINDALSMSLDKANEVHDKDSCSLIFIFSESQELKISDKNIQKIKKLKDSTINLISSSHDNASICVKSGIPKGNSIKFDTMNFPYVIDQNNKYLNSFFIARSYGTKSTKGFYGSYHEED